jgi:hypothetical protein
VETVAKLSEAGIKAARVESLLLRFLLLRIDSRHLELKTSGGGELSIVSQPSIHAFDLADRESGRQINRVHGGLDYHTLSSGRLEQIPKGAARGKVAAQAVHAAAGRRRGGADIETR